MEIPDVSVGGWSADNKMREGENGEKGRVRREGEREERE